MGVAKAYWLSEPNDCPVLLTERKDGAVLLYLHTHTQTYGHEEHRDL